MTNIVRDVASEAPEILTAISDVAHGEATVDNAVAIVRAILQGVAFVDPAAAPIITLVIDLTPIAAELIASGVVRPDPLPIADAQTAASTEVHGRYEGR